jgi:hypothetical protein
LGVYKKTFGESRAAKGDIIPNLAAVEQEKMTGRHPVRSWRLQLGGDGMPGPLPLACIGPEACLWPGFDFFDMLLCSWKIGDGRVFYPGNFTSFAAIRKSWEGRLRPGRRCAEDRLAEKTAEPHRHGKLSSTKKTEMRRDTSGKRVWRREEDVWATDVE